MQNFWAYFFVGIDLMKKGLSAFGGRDKERELA